MYVFSYLKITDAEFCVIHPWCDDASGTEPGPQVPQHCRTSLQVTLLFFNIRKKIITLEQKQNKTKYLPFNKVYGEKKSLLGTQCNCISEICTLQKTSDTAKFFISGNTLLFKSESHWIE